MIEGVSDVHIFAIWRFFIDDCRNCIYARIPLVTNGDKGRRVRGVNEAGSLLERRRLLLVYRTRLNQKFSELAGSRSEGEWQITIKPRLVGARIDVSVNNPETYTATNASDSFSPSPRSPVPLRSR